MVRLREAHEADLHQKDTQLEQQMMTIQQLNTQLEEKDERLREKDGRQRRREEELQEQLQQKETQLQLKDMELQRRNADVSRLQSQLQVCAYLKIHVHYSYTKLHTTSAYKTVFTLMCNILTRYISCDSTSTSTMVPVVYTTISCYDC